ncbi:hypothetical protein F5Y01DRAFT_292675 [Xylaria sp. FL0043]|nr:hypothetical protein F5Y01DRAFT_292675 [Xylaria sp. FL0043]
MRKTPQTQQVLANPPQHTQWPSTTPPRSAVLTVTRTIATGKGPKQAAQLVVCQLLFDGQQKPHTVVAKIYDSLYYDLWDPFVAEPQDVGWLADCHYGREASAYRQLQQTKSLQKPGFAPEYYGSWTFSLPLTLEGKQHRRSIRLVLIEYLAGSTMRDLQTKIEPVHLRVGNEMATVSYPDGHAYHYSEQYRLNILAEVLEGFMMQVHSGVSQGDLAPRNVMLVPSPQGTMPPGSLPRVVLIDYNLAVVSKFTKYASSRPKTSRPRNSAECWWDDRLVQWDGWVPTHWLQPRGWQFAEEWLWATFVKNNPDRFEPIREKLEVNHEL